MTTRACATPFEPAEGSWFAAAAAPGRRLHAARPHRRSDGYGRRREAEPRLPAQLRHRARLRPGDRRGAHRRPGRLDDAAGRPRGHHHQRAQPVRTGLPAQGRTPSSRTTSPPARPPARRPAPAAAGTASPAPPTAGSRSPSTSARTRASRSRSPSPTSPTRAPAASAPSSTTPGSSSAARRKEPRASRPRSAPWSVPGAPAGSPGNSGDWARSQALFHSSAAVTTRNTVLLGFGLENMPAAADRKQVIGKALGAPAPLTPRSRGRSPRRPVPAGRYGPPGRSGRHFGTIRTRSMSPRRPRGGRVVSGRGHPIQLAGVETRRT